MTSTNADDNSDEIRKFQLSKCFSFSSCFPITLTRKKRKQETNDVVKFHLDADLGHAYFLSSKTGCESSVSETGSNSPQDDEEGVLKEHVQINDIVAFTPIDFKGGSSINTESERDSKCGTLVAKAHQDNPRPHRESPGSIRARDLIFRPLDISIRDSPSRLWDKPALLVLGSTHESRRPNFKEVVLIREQAPTSSSKGNLEPPSSPSCSNIGALSAHSTDPSTCSQTSAMSVGPSVPIAARPLPAEARARTASVSASQGGGRRSKESELERGKIWIAEDMEWESIKPRKSSVGTRGGAASDASTTGGRWSGSGDEGGDDEDEASANHCGFMLSSAQLKCPFCGSLIIGTVSTCPKCGKVPAIDDEAFFDATQKWKDPESDDMAPTWALPPDAPVNLHKVIFASELPERLALTRAIEEWKEANPTAPAPSSPPTAPPAGPEAARSLARRRPDAGPGGAGRSGVVGWMTQPVNRAKGQRAGAQGNYQHAKCTPKDFRAIAARRREAAGGDHPLDRVGAALLGLTADVETGFKSGLQSLAPAALFPHLWSAAPASPSPSLASSSPPPSPALPPARARADAASAALVKPPPLLHT